MNVRMTRYKCIYMFILTCYVTLKRVLTAKRSLLLETNSFAKLHSKLCHFKLKSLIGRRLLETQHGFRLKVKQEDPVFNPALRGCWFNKN